MLETRLAEADCDRDEGGDDRVQISYATFDYEESKRQTKATEPQPRVRQEKKKYVVSRVESKRIQQ